MVKKKKRTAKAPSKKLTVIEERQNRQRDMLLEQLKKTPIVQVACQKIDIARATYYRWRKEDHAFKKESDQALEEGSLLVNDMAESKLLSLIQEGNLTGIIFWLKHHHKTYASRVEVTAKLAEQDPLNAEQQQLIREAVRLASLSLPPSSHEDTSHHQTKGSDGADVE